MPIFEQPNETVFTWTAPPIKFGLGATTEVGHDVASLGVTRCVVVTDPGLAAVGLPGRIADIIAAAGIHVEIFDGVHVEPTDASIREAAAWARTRDVDGLVAVGGGSSIDTAKAMNLFYTNEGDLEDYLNKPIGRGLAPSDPLLPLLAVPTTGGTGAESTPVCIIDVLSLKVKTAISHPRLRPSMAIIDPLLSVSAPRNVTALAGMDILCHALESFTARRFDARPRYASPDQRVSYNGGNPVADIWASRALELLGRWIRRAVYSPFDIEARDGVMQAATYAGIGFGNAACHIPHACGYPIAGMVRDYHPADYPAHEAMIPHGLSVVVTAPAAFRFTFQALPERHLEAARLLGGDPSEGVDALPNAIVALCRDLGLPNGIASIGYGPDDIPRLVEGAMMQQRLLVHAPRAVTAADLTGIFSASMVNW
jgi:alcohol dehydrogenase class IV